MIGESEVFMKITSDMKIKDVLRCGETMLDALFRLAPRISTASARLDLVNRTGGAEKFSAVRRWHGVYVAGDLFKMILGIALLALWTSLA